MLLFILSFIPLFISSLEQTTAMNFFKSQFNSLFHQSLFSSPSTECKSLLQFAYLNDANNNTDKNYKKLFISSSKNKNDLSSYYSCIRDEDNYSYYIVSINPFNDNKDKRASLRYEQEKYSFGVCLVRGCAAEEIANITYDISVTNNNFLVLNESANISSVMIDENINFITKTESAFSIIICILLLMQILFVLFNDIPAFLFSKCFRHNVSNSENKNTKTPWRNEITISPAMQNEINRTKLFNFKKCFDYHMNIDLLFSSSVTNDITNETGIAYVKGIRGIAIILSLFGLMYIQLMNFPFKQFEINKYKSSIANFTFIFVNLTSRHLPRCLFACSGFCAVYKFICYLDDKLQMKANEDDKRRSSELADIDKLNGTFGTFGTIFEPEMKDEGEVNYRHLFGFMFGQLYKYIITLLFAFTIRYTVFNMLQFANLSGAGLFMYKANVINNISVLDILGHLTQILNFYIFEVESHSTKCIMSLLWMVINEFFFFIVTIPIIYMCYKRKKNILAWIMVLFIIFTLIRIVIFTVMQSISAFPSYTTLYYYSDDYGAFYSNPFHNFTFYLIGCAFGVANYVVQKMPSDNKKQFSFSKKIISLLKYQNKIIMYIIFAVLFILLILIVSFQQIFISNYYAKVDLNDSNIDFEKYFTSSFVNWVYLFDSDIVILIINYIAFVLFLKGEKSIIRFLSKDSWSFSSKIYFPFITYANIVILFVIYKSETQVPIETFSVFYYGMICWLVLFFVILFHCMFIEFPFKRINYFILHVNKRGRKSIS